jgi:hypothetical protein
MPIDPVFLLHRALHRIETKVNAHRNYPSTVMHTRSQAFKFQKRLISNYFSLLVEVSGLDRRRYPEKAKLEKDGCIALKMRL